MPSSASCRIFRTPACMHAPIVALTAYSLFFGNEGNEVRSPSLDPLSLLQANSSQKKRAVDRCASSVVYKHGRCTRENEKGSTIIT